jgi:hypothetical protein
MLNTSKRIPSIFVFIYLRKDFTVKSNMFFLSDPVFYAARLHGKDMSIQSLNFNRGIDEETPLFCCSLYAVTSGNFIEFDRAKFIQIGAGSIIATVRNNNNNKISNLAASEEPSVCGFFAWPGFADFLHIRFPDFYQ